jgi:hypothetical protein
VNRLGARYVLAGARRRAPTDVPQCAAARMTVATARAGQREASCG